MADHVEKSPEPVETTNRGFFGRIFGKKDEEFDEKVPLSETALPQSEPVAAVSERGPQPEPVESTDRGYYDRFFGKKDEEKKPEAEVKAEDFDEKVTDSEPVVSQSEPVESSSKPEPVESTDRGYYDRFFGKKDEEKKPEEETKAKEFDEKVTDSEPALPQSEPVDSLPQPEPVESTDHFLGKKDEDKKPEEETKAEDFDDKVTVAEPAPPQSEPVEPLPQPEHVESTECGLYDRFLGKKDEDKKPEEETKTEEFDEKATFSKPSRPQSESVETLPQPEPVESTDRGLYDRFLGKKDEDKKPEEETKTEEFDEKATFPEPAPPQSEPVETLPQPESVESTDRGLYDRFLGKKDDDKKPEEETKPEEFDEKVIVAEPAPPQPEPVEPLPQPETVESTDRGLYDRFLGKKDEDKKPEEETKAEVFDEKAVSEPQPEPVVVDSDPLPQPEPVESTDRGLYDRFFGKKEEEKKSEADVKVEEFDKKAISEPVPRQESELVPRLDPVETTDSGLYDRFLGNKDEDKKSEVKAEEYDKKVNVSDPVPQPELESALPVSDPEPVETTNRGLYDRFLGKKDEEKPEADTKVEEFDEKVTNSEHVESTDHFLGKKGEEKNPEAEVLAEEFDQKVNVSQPEQQPEPVVVGLEPARQPEPFETTDRGFYDRLMGKKDEEKKPEAELLASEFDEKMTVSKPASQYEPKPVAAEPWPLPEPMEPESHKEKEGSLLGQFHPSNTNSGASSDEEEVGEDGEKKKKKKKGLMEKLKQKMSGEEKKPEEDTSIPAIENVEVPVAAADEKKGFMEKMKDKLHGSPRKHEEAPVGITDPPTDLAEGHEGEAKEKKGIFKKIKEKMGHHSKTEEEKEAPYH